MTFIPIVVEESLDTQSETLGVLTQSVRIKEVDSDKIRQSLSQLAEELSTIFNEIKQVGAFRLKEIHIQVDVTAEGGIALVGTAKAGVKGAIALKFQCD